MTKAKPSSNSIEMIIEKAQIEEVLHSLVGLPLSYMGRFVGWQRFEFGPQKPFINKKGQEATKADYAIHVACGWRIVGLEGIIVGSDDYGPGSERHDDQGKPFFRMLAQSSPVVESVSADDVGSVHLALTGGYRLDVLPMGAIQAEQWIFLTPGAGAFTLDEQGFES